MGSNPGVRVWRWAGTVLVLVIAALFAYAVLHYLGFVPT